MNQNRSWFEYVYNSVLFHLGCHPLHSRRPSHKFTRARPLTKPVFPLSAASTSSVLSGFARHISVVAFTPASPLPIALVSLGQQWGKKSDRLSLSINHKQLLVWHLGRRQLKGLLMLLGRLEGLLPLSC